MRSSVRNSTSPRRELARQLEKEQRDNQASDAAAAQRSIESKESGSHLVEQLAVVAQPLVVARVLAGPALLDRPPRVRRGGRAGAECSL